MKLVLKIFSLTNSYDVMNILLKKNKISQQIHDKTLNFFSTNNFIENNLVKNELNGQFKELDYETRGKLAKNLLAKNLFNIMSSKQTNLCVAADVTDIDVLLKVNNFLNN